MSAPSIRQRFTLAIAQAIANNEVSSAAEMKELANQTLDTIDRGLSAGERHKLLLTLPDEVSLVPKSDKARMWARGVLDFAADALGKSTSQLSTNVASGLTAIAETAEQPVSADLVTPSALAVLAGLPVDALSQEMQSRVAELGMPGVDTKPADLWDEAISQLGRSHVEKALGDIARASRQLSVGRRLKADGSYKPRFGLDDWGRDYGLHALLPDDPAWTDPEFLTRLNGLAGNVANDYRIANDFRREWKELCPNSSPHALFATGSDAVNYCFTIAEKAGRARLGLPEDSPAPGLLVFSGAYGGGRGPSAEICDYGNRLARPFMARWRVESPFSTNANPTDPEELAHLEELEDAAIARIRERAADTEDPVGAILIEPVPGFHGVYFYRPQFLKRLREVCDELQLPIVADEILSGGGRTGKMWSYQHFDGFEPDWFTFGKNMQACGVAQVQRGSSYVPGLSNITTVHGDPGTMLRASAYMKRVRTGGLIENAAEVGAYILERIRKIEELRGVEVEASGIGMLIGARMYGLEAVSDTIAAEGRRRFMPPLTITREQVDELLAPTFEAAKKRAALKEKSK